MLFFGRIAAFGLACLALLIRPLPAQMCFPSGIAEGKRKMLMNGDKTYPIGTLGWYMLIIFFIWPLFWFQLVQSSLLLKSDEPFFFPQERSKRHFLWKNGWFSRYSWLFGRVLLTCARARVSPRPLFINFSFFECILAQTNFKPLLIGHISRFLWQKRYPYPEEL